MPDVDLNRIAPCQLNFADKILRRIGRLRFPAPESQDVHAGVVGGKKKRVRSSPQHQARHIAPQTASAVVDVQLPIAVSRFRYRYRIVVQCRIFDIEMIKGDLGVNPPDTLLRGPGLDRAGHQAVAPGQCEVDPINGKHPAAVKQHAAGHFNIRPVGGPDPKPFRQPARGPLPACHVRYRDGVATVQPGQSQVFRPGLFRGYHDGKVLQAVQAAPDVRQQNPVCEGMPFFKIVAGLESGFDQDIRLMALPGQSDCLKPVGHLTDIDQVGARRLLLLLPGRW